MHVVSVFYPLGPESKFDMDYYLGTHVPLVHRLLDPMGQRELRVFKGISGGADGTPEYGVMAECCFDDLDSLTAALTAHGAETQADIPNFTDCAPVIQVSEQMTV